MEEADGGEKERAGEKWWGACEGREDAYRNGGRLAVCKQCRWQMRQGKRHGGTQGVCALRRDDREGASTGPDWRAAGGLAGAVALQGGRTTRHDPARGRITSQPGRMNAMRDVTTTQHMQKREGPKGGRAMRWGRDLGQQNRRWADWNVERHTH